MNPLSTDSVAEQLLLLITKHGDTVRVIDALKKRGAMNRNNDAIYHLQKMIGLYKEIEAHSKELKAYGINIYPLDSSNSVCVRSGIENFGIPLKTTQKTKSFNHLGIEVWE